MARPSPKERRKKPRIKHRMVARFDVDGTPKRGVISNFSEAGLFLQTDSRLPIGSIIALRLGTGDTISVMGNIVRTQDLFTLHDEVRPAGLGISVTAASPQYLDLVRRVREKAAADPRGQNERFELRHTVTFRSGEEFLTEYTQNLSQGGMYLATEQPLEQGTVIRAQLSIPDQDEPVEVEGRVAYRLNSAQALERGREAGVGVQFVDLSLETQGRIRHYLTRLKVHRYQVHRRRTEDLPPSGSMTDFLVPEMILALLQKKADGILVLERGGIRKTAYFKSGHPVYAESTLRGETLGAYLVREGKLTYEDYVMTLSELGKTAMRHGEILIHHGLTDTATITEALVTHQEEKITNTFPWFDGNFYFSASLDWPASVSVMPLRTYRLIFGGIEKWFDAPVIRLWLGLTQNIRFLRLDVPPPTAALSPRVLRAVNLLASPRTLCELTASLQIPEDDLLRTLFFLVLAGWAAVDTEKPFAGRKKPVAPEAPPRALTESEEARLRSRVAEDLKRFRHLDFYEMLQITPHVSDRELETAFIGRIGPYSESGVERISDDRLREEVITIASWIRLAYDTLRDPDMRRHYARRGSKKETGISRTAKLDAERAIFKAIRLMKSDRWREAAEMLEEAAKRHPMETDLHGYWGWATYRTEPANNLDEAARMLDFALLRENSDPQLYFYRGELALAQKDYRRAERMFQKATRLNPHFAEAHAGMEKARAKRMTEERDKRR